MKPSLGRTVYCLYNDCIFPDTVYALGESTFIIYSFGTDTYEDSWEWRYDQFNKTWFTSIAKAKKALLKSDIAKLYVNPVLVKTKADDEYYELQEKTYGEKAKWTTVNT